MSSYSLTKSRAFQYVGILLALAALAAGYWYFSVRASTLNKSPTSSLTSGLVGYWTFDGADISGTTATDRSGNANNGTLSNGPTKTEGKLGQALNFNGPAASQYVAIADPGTASVLDFGSASTITLSAWVRPTDFTTTGGDGGVILMKGATNGTDDANYGLLYSDGCTSTCNVQFSFVSGGSAHIFETDQNVLLLNTWTHISATFTFGTAGSIIIYINGIPQSGTWTSGTGSAAPSQTNEALWIGASNYSTGESVDEEFTGSIDEVRLYNRALSAGEVKSLFDLGASDKVNTAATQPGGAGLASGLAGYWKLDENTGTSAGDASTNGNSGTLTNGPTWTTGRIGSAVTFDGTNDYIEMGNVATFNSLSRVTASAWVKTA
ncbi:MAG: LamG domain-containing protein, partial [Candidatus Moraniibacteriota bacterium]